MRNTENSERQAKSLRKTNDTNDTDSNEYTPDVNKGSHLLSSANSCKGLIKSSQAL